MAEKLSDKGVRDMQPPPPRLVKGKPTPDNRITYDLEVKGFGVRVTSAGARAFILNYRAAGRERRITIGGFPDWTVNAARDHARMLKRRIDVGEDPMQDRHEERQDRHEERAAPTLNDLADRFEKEHMVKRRPSTRRDYLGILKRHIRPRLGKVKVADLRHSDIDKLHRAIAKTAPYQANRTVAVLSKMLNLAIKWELRADNPVKGIEREPEQKRERFLTPAELAS